MNDAHLFSLNNKWFKASVGGTAGLALMAAFAGLVWFPLVQRHAGFGSIWDAICSAAGVPQVESRLTPVLPAFKTSQVVVDTDMLNHPTAEAIGQGATIAQRCAMCHGPEGMSGANAPNLAGQPAMVIFKELHDFQTGARVNGVMTPFSGLVTAGEIKEVAAYYAHLAPVHLAGGPRPKIVMEGAPERGIAPCDACHGDIAAKAGAPRLDGQPEAYIKEQLQAFASGERHNDIDEQMRNVARRLTPAEVDEVAQYYATLK